MSVCFIVGAWNSAAGAQGNIENGERTAREACIICHNVEKNGPFKLNPPSFSAIAVYRTDNQIRNRIFYPDVHSGMKQHLGFVFSVDKIDDLVAYIRSLEQVTTSSPAPKLLFV
jgi:mono/diheme cytochrome c family protein